MRGALGAGGWDELPFRDTGLERVGLLGGDIEELLRADFAWVPIDGRDAGRAFS